MKTSANGIELIKRHEGCRLKAYQCPAGVWTIGYGHTATAREGMTIAPVEANILLRMDLKKYEAAVNSHGLPLTQNRFDALVSLCYNIGPGNFNRSKLAHVIKRNPDDPCIRQLFGTWVRAGGKVLTGLARRRREEADLYFKIDNG